MNSIRLPMAVALATFVLAAACEKKEEGSSQPVQSFVSGVSPAEGGADASQQTGRPASPSGGPGVTLAGNDRAINGGADFVNLKGSSPFQQVIVSIGAIDTGAAPLSEGLVSPSGVSSELATGFWRLQLPAAVTETNIVVLFGRNIPEDRFDLRFQLVAPNGAVGAVGIIAMTRQAAGTGDVQVSVTWNSNADVDLHVVEPGFVEIFWGATRSAATGGELDLDSNGDCAGDNIRNENIRWLNPPNGAYTVRVNYYDACGAASTNFAVRVINGTSSQTFTGTFTGPATPGGMGFGRHITTFTRGSAVPSTTGVLSFISSAPGQEAVVTSKKGRR